MSQVTVVCPACNDRVGVPDFLVGVWTNCPLCLAPFVVEGAYPPPRQSSRWSTAAGVAGILLLVAGGFVAVAGMANLWPGRAALEGPRPTAQAAP
jgi:hypothetical protein